MQYTLGNKILQATVGSTAYGLSREGSDIDTLGVFVAPSQQLWRLDKPKETFTGTGPDYTFHEIEKYLRLALKCNPTLMELLWLPNELFDLVAPWGQRLIDIRAAFLSEPYVRNAFGGYAQQQVQRLIRRHGEGKDNFSSDTAKRTGKHARHCMRLLRQGKQLLATGELTVQVDNPEEYFAFDAMTVDEIVLKFTQEDIELKGANSVLPQQPAIHTVESYLHQLRWDYL